MAENNEAPQPVSGDPAALAFEALREEVALVRRAVAGLAAERTAIEIPDYSESLGQIMRLSSSIAATLKSLAALPALRLEPKDWGREIAMASEQARRCDREELTNAKSAFQQAVRALTASVASARSADDQRVWLLWTGIGGALAGLLLWPLGAGAIARAMPESWHWPERMAAHMMGLDREAAGARLIATAAPDRWRGIVLGYRIVADNRGAIARCEKIAAEKTKTVPCAVEIGNAASR